MIICRSFPLPARKYWLLWHLGYKARLVTLSFVLLMYKMKPEMFNDQSFNPSRLMVRRNTLTGNVLLCKGWGMQEWISALLSHLLPKCSLISELEWASLIHLSCFLESPSERSIRDTMKKIVACVV